MAFLSRCYYLLRRPTRQSGAIVWLALVWLASPLLIGCGGGAPTPPTAAAKPSSVAAAKPAQKAKASEDPLRGSATDKQSGSKPAKEAEPPRADKKTAEAKTTLPTEPNAQAETKDEAKAAEPGAPPPNYSAERLLLFTPAGPLVVELKLTIDGKPYDAERDAVIDDLLELADRNHDGKPMWDEVFADPKRVFSRRLSLEREQMDRRQFMKTHDTNQNGVVDRDEARRFIARSNNAGQSFTIDSSSRYRDSNARQSLVRGLLDADGDEIVSAEEMAAAETRLRLRDANDDAIVSLAELDDSLAGDSQAMLVSSYRNSPAAMRLGPLADWDGVIFTFSELYLRHGEMPEGGYSLTPHLAEQLDLDRDGALNRDELLRLDAIDPHVVLAVRFGPDGDTLPGIDVEQIAADLGAADEVVARLSGGAMLNLAELRLRFQFIDRLPGQGPPRSAEDQLSALDTDKNGYLEKKELEEKSPNMAAMFDNWDANGDGMVYPKEIAAYDRGRRAPQATAIRITANDDQDALFPWLDVDLDGRLAPRELRGAAARLKELDADGDGQLAIDEIPGGMTVQIERGATMNMQPQPGLEMAAAEPAPPEGPKWFVFMDFNRDQEVSLREFPGSREKFSRLDLDGDGFISAAEAAAAEGQSGKAAAGRSEDMQPAISEN